MEPQKDKRFDMLAAVIIIMALFYWGYHITFSSMPLWGKIPLSVFIVIILLAMLDALIALIQMDKAERRRHEKE